MDSLQDYDYQQLSALVAELGVPKFRADQLYSLAMRHKSYDEGSNLPVALREQLKGVVRDRAVEIVERLEGKDGVKKYLYLLADGNIIEGVYMPHRYGDTLCVSTQVGCRMGCAFCASGIGGLVRNLTAGEILGQVLAANRDNGGTPEKRKVTNVVLMGSGEPLDNYDNVIRFLKLVGDPRGIGISPRNISLSTSGLADRMIELADSGISVVLTVSLHAATDRKRSALMPVNRKYPIARVIEAARYYVRKTGRRVIFEYALVRGENSDRKSAEELAALLKGLNCHVNLINLNPVKEKGLSGVSPEAIKSFISVLESKGISATLRRSMGGDVEGACGQLRRKYLRQKEEGGQSDAG